MDDDTICEKDYLEKLIEVLDAGYDIASGLTPPMFNPELKRETKFVKPIINEVIMDAEGNFIKNGDDCGMTYVEKEIIPAHHFRSSALIKREVHEKIKYENNLTKCGWREEEFFSFRAIMEGFKIGVHTGAIHWHLLTPSGGQRTADYTQMHQIQDEMFKDFTKKLRVKKDFIKEYNEEVANGNTR